MSSLNMPRPARAIPTPCIGVCTLNADDVCEGCLRRSSEIARWASMSDAERLHIMQVVLPEREARQHEL